MCSSKMQLDIFKGNSTPGSYISLPAVTALFLSWHVLVSAALQFVYISSIYVNIPWSCSGDGATLWLTFKTTSVCQSSFLISNLKKNVLFPLLVHSLDPSDCARNIVTLQRLMSLSLFFLYHPVPERCLSIYLSQ